MLGEDAEATLRLELVGPGKVAGMYPWERSASLCLIACSVPEVPICELSAGAADVIVVTGLVLMIEAVEAVNIAVCDDWAVGDCGCDG